MGNPSSGSKVQTTMTLSKGKHQPSLSVGASLPLEKLGQVENPSSTENLSSAAALRPRAAEEQSITAFLGEKRMKRRTRSSQGLELHAVALEAPERRPLSSVSFGGYRRGGSGSVTPKAAESPRAKGMCTSPRVDKYAVTKIAASLFHSPTKLERSMSMSRVAHRVVPDADGSTPRSRIGVSEVILPDKRDTLAELKKQDSQRELESRLQAVVAHRSENGTSRNPCSKLLEKKVEGSGASLEVNGAVPCANGEYEDSHPKATEAPKIASENPSHGLLGSTEDSWPNGAYLCSNAAHLPVKDIHPVCFETTNKLRTEQATLDMGHDLQEIARSCTLSTVASTQQPYLSRGSNCNEPGLAACEPLHLELQSGKLSNGTPHPENSHRINHPDVLPTSNSCPAGTDLSYQDIKEVTLPRTCEGAFQPKVLVSNQGNEAEKNAHSIAYSSDKAAEAGLLCEKGSVLFPEEPKQVVTDASQDVEKEVGLREANGSGACLRKSTSFELGEMRTKARKRRRSVSASGIGAMFLKIVRTSELDPPEARSLPRAEPEVPDATPLPPTTLHQDAPFETERNSVEAVDMDVEYEDCSSELVAAADSDITVSAEDSSSDKKDSKRPSEEVKLQLVDDTQLVRTQSCTEESQAKLALRDSQEEDQIAGSGSNDERDKRVISSDLEPQLLDERFLDARDKSLDRCNSFESIETSSPSAQAPKGEKIPNQESFAKELTARANGLIKGTNTEDGFAGSQRRRRHGSRGRMSHDLDSCTVAIDESRRSLSLVDENLCMIASLARSRSFASMLQVSPRQSLDESTQPRLAPSSIAILTNPSFSSSHQDRLWEEQAEYSSGGRGTPGRDDDATFPPSPSPSGAVSSDDQIRSAAASLRKGQDRDSSSISCSGFASDSGRSHKPGPSGKKRGRPQRSPLRSLLAAEDLRDNPSPHHQRERRPFLQQILSRIRGSSSSKPIINSPKSSPKRRHTMTWSSCMCFSHVK